LTSIPASGQTVCLRRDARIRSCACNRTVFSEWIPRRHHDHGLGRWQECEPHQDRDMLQSLMHEALLASGRPPVSRDTTLGIPSHYFAYIPFVCSGP